MAKHSTKRCPCPAAKAETIFRLARTCEEKRSALDFLSKMLAEERGLHRGFAKRTFDKHATATYDRAYKAANRACGTIENTRFARQRAGLFGY